MEILKVRNISFNGNKKVKPAFKIKPNHPEHKDESDLIKAGLIATGLIAAAILVEKKKADLADAAKKLNPADTNSKVSEAVADNISDKTVNTAQQEYEKTVETIEDVVDRADTVNPEKTLDAEKETIAEAQEELSDISSLPKTDNTNLAENEVAEDIIEPETNKTDVLKQTFTKTSKEINENIQKNSAFINKSKKTYPKLYKDFGVDKRIEDKVLQMDSRLVQEINDDEFLSLLLAPSEELTLSFKEAMQMPIKRNPVVKKLQDSVLGFTKNAKYKRSLERRYRLNTVVSTILPQNDRIKKLQIMEEVFTPEDISKIFNSDNLTAKNLFLSWLMEFHTKSKDDQIMSKLQGYIE